MASLLIDSHCHLDFPVFDDSRDQVLKRAQAVNVAHIVVPGVVARDFPRVLAVQRAYPETVSIALGLHPCFMKEHAQTDVEVLAAYLDTTPVCALGEIGLDFYDDEADKKAQLALLKAQIKLAKAHQLPLILHVRKAHDEMLKVLREMQFSEGGIVHAFSGSEQQAHRYIDRGFLIGVGGAITYSRAQRLRSVIAKLPLQALALETDSPDMLLDGFQGRPNEPARMAVVLDTLSALREEPRVVLGTEITKNTRQKLNLSTGV